MVWDCISSSRVGDLVKTDGNINAQKYDQILTNHVIPSGKYLTFKYFIFQHDDNPKNTFTPVKASLNRKNTISHVCLLTAELLRLVETLFLP